MNRLFAILLMALSVVVTVRAQSSEEQYVRIYNTIQQADGLNTAGKPQEALTKYLEAQTSLQRMQKLSPDWNPKVVAFRLNYLAEKISGISASAPAPVKPTVVAPAPTPGASAANPAVDAGAPPRVPAEVEAQLGSLQEQVRQLAAEKTILEAKLKEALATQPAAIDPRELAKAEEKIQTLLKENNSLKVSIEQEKAKPDAATSAQELDTAKRELAESTRKLAEEQSRVEKLQAEGQSLRKKLDSLEADSKELASAKQALDEANKKASEQAAKIASLNTERAGLLKKLETIKTGQDEAEAAQLALKEANRRLADQSETLKKLSAEKAELEARGAGAVASNAEAIEALRAENALLKRQLAAASTTPATSQSDDANARRLAQAEAKVALLQSEAEVLRLEKSALEERVRKPVAPETSPILATDARSRDARRIKQLETERDDLKKRLASANTELSARRNSGDVPAKISQLTKEIESLRARVDVFEARAVPYTTEELALFKPSSTELSVSVNGPASSEPRKPSRSLPSGTAALAAEAQKFFASREFDKAEAKYLEILKQDDRNVYTLANLAAIQMEMGKYDAAEKNVRTALESVPEDAYTLSILGYLKFRQEKYDEALDALSRAAKLNPQSAEIQNYLGVTLSHKGQRGPAETALRKAIQIDPNYAKAHNNLAVIYVSQNPPLVQLARWHYQKALAAGHERNAELEKLLEKPAGADK